MRHRDFITLLGGAATWPATGLAHQTIPVVAFLFQVRRSVEQEQYVKSIG